MFRSIRYALLLSAAAMFVLSAPASPVALAAVGDLTQQAGTLGCIEISPTNSGDPCQAATYGLGLDGAAYVQTFGANVYVTSTYGIEVLQKDAQDSGLTDLECVDGDGSDYGTNPECAKEPMMAGGSVDVGSIRFSPDGKWAFVDNHTSSSAGSELIVFSRNATTGDLAEASCYSANGDNAAGDALCTNLETANVQYDAGGHLAVSPNGKWLFADNGFAITVFGIDDSTGALTATSCADESDVGGCAGTFPANANSNAGAMEVSPDNKFLYFSAPNDPAVEWMSINQSTGKLTDTGSAGSEDCIQDVSQSGGDDGCVASMRGMVSMTESLAISPDSAGKYVYALSGSEGAVGGVAVLSRNSSTGALSQVSGVAGCATSDGTDDENSAHETGGPLPCENDPGMEQAESVVTSPDGQNLYVMTGYEGDESMIELYADPSTGALTENSDAFAACYTSNIRSDALPFCTGYNALYGIDEGLNGEPEIAVSPDGRSVYVTSGGDSGLAIFQRQTPVTYAVAGAAAPTAGGTVTAQSSSTGAQCAGSGCSVFTGGAVTLSATANPGYRFKGWSGGSCSGTTNPCTVSNVQVSETDTAVFVQRLTVSATVSGGTGGSVTATDVSNTANCSGASCTVDAGDTVILTASPSAGQRLAGWSGGSCSGSANRCTIMHVQASETDTATFKAGYIVTATLSQIAAQAGNRVSASDSAAGASCSGGTCGVNPGDTVTLTATAASTFTFSGWSGGSCSGSSNPCVIKNVAANETDTAAFTSSGLSISGVVSDFTGYGPGGTAPLLHSYSGVSVQVVDPNTDKLVSGPVQPKADGSYSLIVPNGTCAGTTHPCRIVLLGPGSTQPKDAETLAVQSSKHTETINLAYGDLDTIAIAGKVLTPPDGQPVKTELSLMATVANNQGHQTQETVFTTHTLCQATAGKCSSGPYLLVPGLSGAEERGLAETGTIVLSQWSGSAWVPIDSRRIAPLALPSPGKRDINNALPLQTVDPVPATNQHSEIVGRVTMLDQYAPTLRPQASRTVTGYTNTTVTATVANGAHHYGTAPDSHGYYQLGLLSTTGNMANIPYTVQVSAKKSGTTYKSFDQSVKIPKRADPSTTLLDLWFSKDGEVPLYGYINPVSGHTVKTELVVTDAQGTIFDSLTNSFCSGAGGACSVGKYLIGLPAPASPGPSGYTIELKEENSSGKWVRIQSVSVLADVPPIYGLEGQNVPTLNAEYPVPAH